MSSSPVTTEVGAALTDFDHRVAASILSLTHALRLPKDTLGYLVDYLGLNQPTIPISQVIGFTGFNPQIAPMIATGESTVSTTYTDLATVGPLLTGLPDGEYLLLFGCQGQVNASFGAGMSVEVNGVAAVDADNCQSATLNLNMSVMRALHKTLSSANNNSITAKYRAVSGNGTTDSASFALRTLIAIKYAEL